MPGELAQLILDRISSGGNVWPPRSETNDWRTVNTYRAVLDSDRDTLRELHENWPRDKPYRVDALPERIARAWADHLFGEDPIVEAATQGDQPRLDPFVEGEFVSDLREAAARNVGEGEQWWRVYVDEDVADTPLLEWHSRLNVIPYFVGTKLKAAALVTELEGVGRRATKHTVWRHLEIHYAGTVEHLLFRGTAGKLGTPAPLRDHTETEGIALVLGDAGVWQHGLPMLMGRVYNRRGRRPRLGRSEFVTNLDQLLDLNEAASIGASNMRLTAKKRAIIPESQVLPATTSGRKADSLVDRGDGTLIPTAAPAQFRDEDLIVVSDLDAELGKGSGAPFEILEYSFDAEPLIAWKRDLVETALTRIGLTPQWVGVQTEQGDGYALTGTALRLRLIPTTKAGHGKGKTWDDTLPYVLSLMAQVDALGQADGGFGRPWADPTSLPSVERADPLPVDEVEDSQVESTLVSAGVRSVETSIRRQHPDWSDAEVTAELDRISGDKPAPPTIIRQPVPPAPGGPAVPPPDDPTAAPAVT